MEQLGNSAHSIPFLAVFPGDKPNEPRVLADWFTKDDLLQVLADAPDPSKLEMAQERLPLGR